MFHKLFHVAVYEFEYSGKILEEIQNEIRQELLIQESAGFVQVTKEENPRVGSLYTTSGAFNNVNNFIDDDLKFPIFKNEILKNIKHYCVQNDIEMEIEPFIRSSWFTITKTDNSASTHTHLWEDLVAVYYYKADGDEGNIRLHSPHDKIKYTNTKQYEIIPNTGKFLIFPGWLKHSVLVNETTKDRVSVAVNIKIFKDYEYDRP
jgi:uncharacterized protein (TIGR02466 family)